MPPLLNLPAVQLLRQLAGEYLFAQFNEALVHSYAAENLARLQTMTAAREHIRKKLEVLSSQEQQARQSVITAEMIELVAGSGGMNALPQSSAALKQRCLSKRRFLILVCRREGGYARVST